MPESPPNADHALGAVVRRLRTERGESLETLAHRAGLTFATLTKIELAQSSPHWFTVRQIAEALEVSMGELGAQVDRER